MIKEYLTVTKGLSFQELELNINKELMADELSMVRLLVLSVVLVDRVAKTFRISSEEKEYLKLDSVMACLSFLVRSHRRKTSLEKINQIIRKELNLACNHIPTPDIDYVNDPFFTFADEQEDEDPARNYLKSKVFEVVMESVPLRLKPIIFFYMDTGFLMDSLLGDIDRSIVKRTLYGLGNWNMLDTEELLKDMPSTVRGKSLFLAFLADKHPEVFIIMTLLGDVNKLAIITEILGGKTFSIPTTEKLGQIIADSTKASSDAESGKASHISDSYLRSIAGEMGISSEMIPANMMEYFDKFMNLEYANYIGSLETMSRRVAISPGEAGKYFSTMNNEFKSAVNILDRLKALTS